MSTIVKKLHWNKRNLKCEATTLEDVLSDAGQDLDVLRAHWEQFTPAYNEFKEIASELFDNDVDITEELKAFKMKYNKIKAAAESRLPKPQTTGNPNHTSVPYAIQTPQVKLPVIELPTFSGSYDEWQGFCDSFTSLIHNNASLGNIQKFQYLQSSLKGEAATVLKAIKISDTAYDLAWSQLRDRYQNERFIVKKHVRTLIHLPNVKKDNYASLRTLIDMIALNLASLKALNRPADTWSDLLIEIIAEKLDIAMQKEWEGSTCNKIPTYAEMEEFLTIKCQQLEAVNGLSSTPNHAPKIKTMVLKSTERKCVFCDGSHTIYKCESFIRKPVEERIDIAKMKSLCYNCLGKNHTVNNCKSGNCRECNKRHNSLLHKQQAQFANSTPMETSASVSTLAYSPSTVLLSTCVLLINDNTGKPQQVRTLLDSGSQANLITESCTKKLGLEQHPLSTPIVGVGGSKINNKSMISVQVKSRVTQFALPVNALVIDKITERIPDHHCDVRGLCPPVGAQLADPTYHTPQKIDLLIGAGHYYEPPRLDCGRSTTTKPRSQPTHSATVGYVGINELVSRFWQIESYTQEAFTPENRKCEQHFQTTVKRKPNGRFEVALPFKTDPNQLGDSSISARHRFFALERRLAKQPNLYEAYREFMREYLELGHMHPTAGDVAVGYYMPHHCVVKEDSLTTKLRVVFNGSAPSSSGVSLNNVLMVGPSLQEDLFAIMLRMRTKQYVITADITKMYRQIDVRLEDRKYQRIWWRETPQDKLLSYELATVTYGTAPAAYLAIRAVRELAAVEASSFPIGSKTCLKDFYVDDLITGADTVDELILIRDEVSALLTMGCFTLKQWASNDTSVFECFHVNNNDPVTVLTRDFCDNVTTLGAIWNTNSDHLSYKCIDLPIRAVTKRTILSDISRIYDPLGLIGPVIIVAKVLIQDLWKLKCGWDDPLPSAYLIRWNRYAENLPQVTDIAISRKVLPEAGMDIELHGFADASEYAYGACIYLVCVKNNIRVSCNLLCAKSRVAPVQSTTIPRLELCAALLLAELSERVCTALDISIVRQFYYSDSVITLSWIKSESRKFKTFVANRVGDIYKITDPADWHHVTTKENPADIISRGLSPSELIESELWWNGPQFILQHTPSSPFTLTADLPEVKCMVLVTEPDNLVIPVCSSFEKTVRVMAYVLRFKSALVHPAGKKLCPLTVDELSEATTVLILNLQLTEFKRESVLLKKGVLVQRSSKLISLNPFIDADGLIRVGGRLMDSDLPLARRCPIVLPCSHRLTKLIIISVHHTLLHAGTQGTLAAVRMKYWPLNGRSVTRDIVRKCIRCVRAKPHFHAPIMGALPSYRTQQFRPFLKCGVDYCGPFTIKDGSRRSKRTTKVYVCIFVCFATKAVHVELVSDLTTGAFLATLFRFISRRGCVAEIYSDNATNFVGARNRLRELGLFLNDVNERYVIETTLSSQNIKWIFIPPRAPHFGGLWESAVKSVKHHLHRVAGNALLTYPEFQTLLTQVEAVLNSRPLCSLSEDPNDFTALTPGHFLIGDAITAPIHPDYSEVPTNRLSRWEHIEKIRQHLWKRWQREYLTELHKRVKWQQNGNMLKVGDLVIVKEDNSPPLHWKLGRVDAIHPGRDGVHRSVTVRTSIGSFHRPVTKLCPLSSASESACVPQLEIESVGFNGGRNVNRKFPE